MTAKKLGIYLADSSLETLRIVGGNHDGVELALSSSVNLCVQFCTLVARDEKIPLTVEELLFCCDILNGGAHMTEFRAPDSASIAAAFDGMIFGLQDAARNNYGCEVEKWGISPSKLITRLELMRSYECQLFALAFATRQFWAGEPFGEHRPLRGCADYQEWARQWTDPDL